MAQNNQNWQISEGLADYYIDALDKHVQTMFSVVLALALVILTTLQFNSNIAKVIGDISPYFIEFIILGSMIVVLTYFSYRAFFINNKNNINNKIYHNKTAGAFRKIACMVCNNTTPNQINQPSSILDLLIPTFLMAILISIGDTLLLGPILSLAVILATISIKQISSLLGISLYVIALLIFILINIYTFNRPIYKK
ncbi:MAG: hypothetical protein JRN26_04360 [Nitrososphaerota archaeon]|jgi:hypothetical protein|nr:hypothetical protein [Nitrososphaerota archaeon]MDG6932532.1 hypothetical protein [Nitrososphaerota archaeon]MDG6936097.1 hypothetical protein [Nitrososphaerota archaeon]MDG6944533.1 hypothetical protein [Nitrososphaerota archaeon]